MAAWIVELLQTEISEWKMFGLYRKKTSHKTDISQLTLVHEASGHECCGFQEILPEAVWLHRLVHASFWRKCWNKRGRWEDVCLLSVCINPSCPVTPVIWLKDMWDIKHPVNQSKTQQALLTAAETETLFPAPSVGREHHMSLLAQLSCCIYISDL